MADLPVDAFRSSTHAFGLAETIRLARMLDRLPKKLTVYGIEGAHFVAGAPPSPAVLEGVQRAVDEIASTFAERTISPRHQRFRLSACLPTSRDFGPLELSGSSCSRKASCDLPAADKLVNYSNRSG
jgi:hypothetical protein